MGNESNIPGKHPNTFVIWTNFSKTIHNFICISISYDCLRNNIHLTTAKWFLHDDDSKCSAYYKISRKENLIKHIHK